jgi:hypothetical protein
MNEQEIAKDHKKRMDTLAEKYGSFFLVPRDEMSFHHERTRALYVQFYANQKGVPTAKAMREHGIAQSIAQTLGADPLIIERKVKRQDKYKTIVDWCDANPGSTVNGYMLAEIGGVSYATANQFIKDRIDLFRKVKRGEYIVRNPEVERAQEKQ